MGAAKRMHRQWNTTVQQFDEVVEHLIDNSASSEDECSDKLTEAKRRLHDIHEKVTTMAEHVNVSEKRTQEIITKITDLEEQLNGTKTVCEDRVDKCGNKRETEKEILQV